MPSPVMLKALSHGPIVHGVRHAAFDALVDEGLVVRRPVEPQPGDVFYGHSGDLDPHEYALNEHGQRALAEIPDPEPLQQGPREASELLKGIVFRAHHADGVHTVRDGEHEFVPHPLDVDGKPGDATNDAELVDAELPELPAETSDEEAT